MSIYCVKSKDLKWEKFFGIDINIEAMDLLRKVKTAIVSDSKMLEHMGASFEVWDPTPPLKWHFNYEAIIHILWGGPLKMTCEGKTHTAYQGDFIIITKDSDAVLEVGGHLVFATVTHPPVDVIKRILDEKHQKKR